MVRPKRLLPGVVLLFLLTGVSVYAQRTEYQKDAQNLATLFRGRLPVLYPYRYNGTYYLDTREFQPGSVWYNGKVYEDVLLNLNANQMELEVRPSRE